VSKATATSIPPPSAPTTRSFPSAAPAPSPTT